MIFNGFISVIYTKDLGQESVNDEGLSVLSEDGKPEGKVRCFVRQLSAKEIKDRTFNNITSSTHQVVGLMSEAEFMTKKFKKVIVEDSLNNLIFEGEYVKYEKLNLVNLFRIEFNGNQGNAQ